MSDFGDLRQFLDRDLTLTVDGNTYTIAAPTAEKGLELRARVVMGQMTDFDEVVSGAELCGGKWDAEKGEWIKPKNSVFAKLMRDLDWDSVYRVIKTALIFYTVSRERAVVYWQTGSMFEDEDNLEESPAPSES